MAYSEKLADRVRTALLDKNILFDERKMMGGLCFMVNDKMCAGISDEKLMARIGPEVYETALKKKRCREMDFTGRPMKGFVFIEKEGISKKTDLEYWIQLCIEFNPLAKSSKKRKK